MCNWCQNHFVIYGDDKGQLLRFYMDMSAAISDHPNFTPHTNSWDNYWVGNLFLQAGYDGQDLSDTIECRGGVQDIFLESDCVVIDDETAWVPNNRSMQRMLDEKYPGLEMVFRSEEPGMEIYVNSDIEGKFIKDRYIVDCYTDGDSFESISEYYETWEEVLDLLSELTGKTVQEITQARSDPKFSWETFVRTALNIPDEESCYIGVYDYAPDY